MSTLVAVSGALVALTLVAGFASFGRGAGRLRVDETWVPQGPGMSGLQVSMRRAWVVRGRFEFQQRDYLRAVIPSGSSAAGATLPETRWFLEPLEPEAAQTLSDRWHLTAWNNWRFGDLGCYSNGAGLRVISAPSWIVTLLLGTPLWIWLTQVVRRRRRATRGECVKCGYDRRDRARGESCPECGFTPRVPTRSVP